MHDILCASIHSATPLISSKNIISKILPR